ncbi:MAG TPA: hypothetical protein VFV81_06240 [Verrucomicrobiae bacterium]|nr:hypothetical protein [Verrucomicrobiae bacterium]
MADSADMMALMLLVVHLLALTVACLFCIGMMLLHRNARRLRGAWDRTPMVPFQAIFPRRPASWIAIRSAEPEQVRMALDLQHLTPCSWSEGMAGEHQFFISPRVNGWVIVTGIGIPGFDDIDECFRFLAALSRKTGHVQFFQVEKFSHHHAWARMDDGCVTRAYAWTGETIWNQGAKTMPEIELGLKCFDYGDADDASAIAEANAERVPLLAARWSLDPAAIDERLLNYAPGLACELRQVF